MLFFFLLSTYGADAATATSVASSSMNRDFLQGIMEKAQERLNYYSNPAAISSKLTSSSYHPTIVTFFDRKLPGRIRLFQAAYQNITMLCQLQIESVDAEKQILLLAHVCYQTLNEQNGLCDADLSLSTISDTDERPYLKTMIGSIPREIRESEALKFVNTAVAEKDLLNGKHLFSQACNFCEKESLELNKTCQSIFSYCHDDGEHLAAEKDRANDFEKRRKILFYEIELIDAYLQEVYAKESRTVAVSGRTFVCEDWSNDFGITTCRLKNIAVLNAIEMYHYFVELQKISKEAEQLRDALKRSCQVQTKERKGKSKKKSAPKKQVVAPISGELLSALKASPTSLARTLFPARVSERYSSSLFQGIAQAMQQKIVDFSAIESLVDRVDKSDNVTKTEFYAAICQAGTLIPASKKNTSSMDCSQKGGRKNLCYATKRG